MGQEGDRDQKGISTRIWFVLMGLMAVASYIKLAGRDSPTNIGVALILYIALLSGLEFAERLRARRGQK